MIKIGDTVFVQNKGICKVENIAKNAFVGCDKNKEYYVLKPVGSPNNMVVYFPTDTKVNIRKLTSKAKADTILKNINNLADVEVSADDDRLAVYTKISQSGELEDWAKLLKTLLIRKSKTTKKQFNFQEQKLITLMINCVASELSYVLSKDKEEIRNTIFSSLGVAE